MPGSEGLARSTSSVGDLMATDSDAFNRFGREDMPAPKLERLHLAARIVQQLQAWVVQSLPAGDVGAHTDILIWLVTGPLEGRPLKDLYRTSRYSEPTVRSCLKKLEESGLVSIRGDSADHRRKLACPSAKLLSITQSLNQRLEALGVGPPASSV